MAYNTKAIKTDVNGNPISQYYNPNTDEYEPVEGAGGGNKVVLYNEDGTPNNSLSLGEILDKLDQLKGTVIDEETRKQNEQIRQQNEQQRIDLYNALKDLDVSQYELRLQKLEHDTSVEKTMVEEAYGPVISLPENVVNGQINDIRIEGKTYRNVLEDYISDSNNWERLDGELIDNDFIKGTADGDYKNFWLKAGIITLKPNTQYTIFVEVRKNTLTGGRLTVTSTNPNDSFGVTNAISPGGTGIFKFLATTKSDLTNAFPLRMFIPPTATSGEVEFRVMLLEGDYTNENISYIRGTKSTLSAIRLKSVNEDETKESTLYVLGKDEEGNILELHSLPNGVKDEIDVANRKSIKRIGEKANVSSGTVINYTDMAEGGTYYAWNENGETETGTKGDILGIDATVLIYQLANPIEILIEVFGNLQSYENGTVYVETIIPRVDFYTPEGIELEGPPEKEPRIKEIDSLYLVNRENGLLIPLDISKAIIQDIALMHPDLVGGALVVWDYIPDVEGTNPTILMKLPINLKASVTSALEGVQKLSSETKSLNTRVIANHRDIETLNESLFSNVMDLRLSLTSHEEKNVTDSGGVHGLEIESGTFTPYLYGANVAGSHTYARQLGYYYRIGKLVHIDITIQINSGDLDTNMSGNLRIGGLPFVNAVGTNRNVGLAKGRISNFKYDNYEEILCFIPTNNNYIQIVGARNGQTLFSITVSDLGTIDTIIEVSGTYEIA